MPSAIRFGNRIIKQSDSSPVTPSDSSPVIPSAAEESLTQFVLLDNLKYKYDSCGNITEVRENGALAARYSYDKLNRLIREDNKQLNKTTLFTYDNNGNILSKRELAFTLKDTALLEELTELQYMQYGYDGDKLLSFGNETFAYDVLGNPTIYRNKPCTWEKGRQLTSYNGVTFAYDGKGRRINKIVDGLATTFTYDHSGNIIAQSNGLEFVYDNTEIIGIKHNNITYFYRRNAQGDIIALLDNSGKVVVKYVYDAWGNHRVKVLDSTCTELSQLNPFRYRGYYYDTETGLYYLKTRYYDPEVGRFITIDDLSYLDPETINGLNLYAYCGNNPVMAIDPEGTKKKWWQKLLIGIGIVLGTALFVAAIVASAGTVGALAGVGAAALGLSAGTVATIATVATIGTYVVAAGVGLFGLSDAIEVWTGGINPIRDYIMGGSQKAYNITHTVFDVLGTIAVIAGAIGPKILKNIKTNINFNGRNTPLEKQRPNSRLVNVRGDGYQMNFYDKAGNWSLRVDAYTQLNHTNPHVHFLSPKSDGNMLGILWQICKWFRLL